MTKKKFRGEPDPSERQAHHKRPFVYGTGYWYDEAADKEYVIDQDSMWLCKSGTVKQLVCVEGGKEYYEKDWMIANGKKVRAGYVAVPKLGGKKK